METLMNLTPWRKKHEFTAGRVQLALQIYLRNIRVRDWWNSTSRKFQPPFYRELVPDEDNRSEPTG